MSMRTFQSMLARMVADPDFRDDVRSGADGALDADLTPIEVERLRSVAVSRGLDAHRTLHKSFRLGKLYTLLPLTCALLGDDLLATEVSLYWAAHIPTSFYFLGEAIEFCDHLLGRLGEGRIAVDHLDEIVAYERAGLELERPRPEGELPEPQVVLFRHDPEAVISAVARGESPGELPEAEVVLIGTRGSDGAVGWHFADEAGA
jgi:hypothetical protein